MTGLEKWAVGFYIAVMVEEAVCLWFAYHGPESQTTLSWLLRPMSVTRDYNIRIGWFMIVFASVVAASAGSARMTADRMVRKMRSEG